MTMTETTMKAAAIVAAASLIAAFVALLARSEAARERDAARTEAERAREDLNSCEMTVEALRTAGEAERKAREITEAKKNEVAQKMEAIRADSCRVDDGGGTLDARLRDLAVEAYRVAVCTSTDGDGVQNAGGAAP